MAEKKQSSEKQASPDAEKVNAEVQDAVDQETEQGFRGVKVDEHDDLEYSVQSGPDSPTNEKA